MTLTEKEYEDLTDYTARLKEKTDAGLSVDEGRRAIEAADPQLARRVHTVYAGGGSSDRELLDDGGVRRQPMSRSEKQRALERAAIADALGVDRSVSDATLVAAMRAQVQDAKARRSIAEALGLDGGASVDAVIAAFGKYLGPAEDAHASEDPRLRAAALLASGLTLSEVRTRFPELGSQLEAFYDEFGLAARRR